MDEITLKDSIRREIIKEFVEITMPPRNPKRLIFDRREDGLYNVTSTGTAIDTKSKKEIEIEVKAISRLPDYIIGMPLELKRQNDSTLYTINICEGNEE